MNEPEAVMTATKALSGRAVEVGTPAGPYVRSGFLMLFTASFFLYIGYNASALAIAALAFILLPLMWRFDRVRFDGRRLRRTGLLFRAANRAQGMRDRLKLSDIEQVDTQYLRLVSRGGRVHYRFRTAFRGKGVSFTAVSGGERYRRFVRTVLPLLNDEVMDTRSLELRDYLVDSADARLQASKLQIPASDVLEPLLGTPARGGRREKKGSVTARVAADAAAFRRLGNELRLEGSLARAIEAFRRAMIEAGGDAWLLFDAARCLYAYSGSKRNGRLQRRAIALMRLAEKRAGGDGELLSRIGETYTQMGDWNRAASVFRRIADSGKSGFRSLRGQAEIALREGKIAHVIHNFRAAAEATRTPALRRWATGEMNYFSNLNDDEEYMELEVSRVNLIDSLERTRRTTMRISFVGMLAISVGLVLGDSTVSNVGWAIALIALAAGAIAHAASMMLERRLPFDLAGKDDQA